MATVELTTGNFSETITGNEIVLVDFWAEWCGPCRAFGPVFEKVSEEHPDAVFAKVDTEAQTELAASFNVQSIPTLIAFRDGIILYAQPGALPEKGLQSIVEQVKALDMDDVRKQLAGEAKDESEETA